MIPFELGLGVGFGGAAVEIALFLAAPTVYARAAFVPLLAPRVLDLGAGALARLYPASKRTDARSYRGGSGEAERGPQQPIVDALGLPQRWIGRRATLLAKRGGDRIVLVPPFLNVLLRPVGVVQCTLSVKDDKLVCRAKRLPVGLVSVALAGLCFLAALLTSGDTNGIAMPILCALAGAFLTLRPDGLRAGYTEMLTELRDRASALVPPSAEDVSKINIGI